MTTQKGEREEALSDAEGFMRCNSEDEVLTFAGSSAAEKMQRMAKHLLSSSKAEGEMAKLIEAAYRLGVKEGLQKGPVAVRFCCTPDRARAALTPKDPA